MGCYIVSEVLREIAGDASAPVCVLGVSAVQEETGGVGAGQVAHQWQPSLGIAFDATSSQLFLAVGSIAYGMEDNAKKSVANVTTYQGLP